MAAEGRGVLAAILSAWLQYAADGKPHGRAVVNDATCPSASVDGRGVPMQRRVARTDAFADTVCDATVPAGAKRVHIGDRALPIPARDPRRIVVLGDTGCRLSGALNSQACDDPAAWPFPVIARAIAAAHPDLIVHVGDYLYRESACPALVKCAGSPHGDDAPAWYADFLAPAAPLFASAPLVLVRGNHEECDRNGTGWFRYFDPHPQTACENAAGPYAVDLGDLRLVVFDSAVAEDRVADPARTAVYRPQFARVRELAQGARAAWFVTHRPPYTNDDERTAMGGALEPFGAVLAGHLHFFAAMNVAPPLPPLLINGEGGTRLDPDYAPFLGFATGPVRVEGSVFGSAHFGFAVYTREGAGWTISLRGAGGEERTRCTLVERAVRCTLETG